MSATDGPKGSSGAGLESKSEPANSKPTFKTGLIARTPPAKPSLFLDLTKYRPTLNKKRTASFLSVRKWPSKQKDLAISILKDAKDRGDVILARSAADEIATILSTWLRPEAQIKITAPPPGVRRPHHFATMIAQATAAALGLEYQSTFAPRMARGSSFPKADSNRGLMKMSAPAFGHWILIDDVSSSGSTLETALHTLLTNGAQSVIPVCWIYGSADKDFAAEPFGVADSVFGSPASITGDEGEQTVDGVTRDQFIARVASQREGDSRWPTLSFFVKGELVRLGKMFDDLKAASSPSFSRPNVNAVFATA